MTTKTPATVPGAGREYRPMLTERNKDSLVWIFMFVIGVFAVAAAAGGLMVVNSYTQDVTYGRCVKARNSR